MKMVLRQLSRPADLDIDHHQRATLIRVREYFDDSFTGCDADWDVKGEAKLDSLVGHLLL